MPLEVGESAGFARTPLREGVYRLLLAAIVSGELAPGERIRDHEIAEQLDVSRTPVREALQRLEVEALVETRPGAVTRVSELSSDSATDVFPIIAELHALAARLGVPRLTDEAIAEMRAVNRAMHAAAERGDVFAAMEHDTAFHRIAVDAACNTELSRLVAQLEPKARRLEYTAFQARQSSSVHTHEEIVTAFVERDVARVEQLVRTNWLVLGERLAGELARQLPEAVPGG